MLTIRDRPSPNFNQRPAGRGVELLILHYTGMTSAAAALERLCDPEAQVSAHYLIDEDGAVTQMVAEEHRAWHAGVAYWAGERDINGCSIGIELVNPGHEFGYRDFPEAQMKALLDLALDIQSRHAIPAAKVLGHSDVAPLRKTDPGERFDWPRLAAVGLGLWPASGPPLDSLPDAAEAKAWLEILGYGFVADDFPAVLSAFQRRYRPMEVDGQLDGETAARLKALVQLRGKTVS